MIDDVVNNIHYIGDFNNPNAYIHIRKIITIMFSLQSDEETINSLIEIVNMINSDMQSNVMYYNPIYER